MAPDGIRVDMRVEDPETCPVASASETFDARVENVVKAVDGDDYVVEFTVVSETVELADDFETVFENDAVTRLRHCGSTDRECACRLLSEYGCPTSDVTAEDGSLSFSFYTTDMETLESVVETLRSQCGNVHVTELARTHDVSGRDPATVDRARLTSRQREVLETALEMGYFETPKRANAGDVADEIGVSLPTVCEHLSVGQRKLLVMALDAERNGQ